MSGEGLVATAMQFGLLGPLFVQCDGSDVAVPRGKQRAVLAALLLDAGRVVSVDELIGVMWGAAPPASARASLQNHVKRLRHALGAAGRGLIGTRPGGYVISINSDDLDVRRFEALLRTTRTAVRESVWDVAARQASAAAALWRGEPLADAGSDSLAAREVPRLAEMRLQALEMRIDADLHLGRHSEVISELQRLAPAYPMRERLHAMLMLAFYRDGRQGEALAVYRHARGVLAEELGAEPGIELRELNRRILAADPALAAADGSLEGTGAARAARRRRRHGSHRPGNGSSPAGRFSSRRLPGCPPGRENRRREHPR